MVFKLNHLPKRGRFKIELSLLVTPAICGVVGYFTNLIAIKMLFLPRYEKRIMGMKVPFTPGLLPKSKSRMAHSVGETVGGYLLTESSIKEAVINSGVENIINDFLDKTYKELSESDKHISDYLAGYLESNTEAVESMKEKFILSIKSYILENKKAVIKGLYEEIKGKLISMDAEKYYLLLEGFVSDKVFEKYKDIASKGGFSPLIDDMAKDFLLKISGETKNIKEYIPEELQEEIKNSLLNYMPKAGIYIAQKLNSDIELNERLMELVKTVINDSVGSLIGSLVYRKVYESIKDSTIEYISDAEKLIGLYEKAEGYLEEILNKPLGEFIKNIDENMICKILSKGESLFLNENNVQKLISLISDKFRRKISPEDKSLYDIIEIFCSDFEEKALELLSEIWDREIEPKTYEMLNKLSDKLIRDFMNLEIGSLMKGLGYERYHNIKVFIMNHKDNLIEKAASFVSEKLNVRHMVEEKINEMDVRTIEKIVIDVARKELNYITYMGGVLGFIIGLVPEIIKLL